MNFRNNLQELNIHLTDNQLEKFEIYHSFLIEYNKITNLTRITEREEVFIKHFYDSLTLNDAVDFSKINTLCDMGSGAGFPSIPLKIIYPHLEVTIVDSLNKRIEFLKQLLEKLEIENVSLIHDRMELYAIKHQDYFDLVTARALGNMSLISEMGLPITKINGIFIAMKALNYEEELHQAKNAIKILGGNIECIKHFDLPDLHGNRTLIVIRKSKSIKGYPRSFALMNKKPL